MEHESDTIPGCIKEDKAPVAEPLKGESMKEIRGIICLILIVIMMIFKIVSQAFEESAGICNTAAVEREGGDSIMTQELIVE